MLKKFKNKKLITLTASVILAGAILVSCNSNATENSSAESFCESESRASGESISETQSQSESSSETTNPSVDLSKYSSLVQGMLTDSTYVNLLNSAKAGNVGFGSAHFDPHPYTFLEEQGHDIAKVKAGDYECKTQAFVKKDEPNNLYIATYIENAGSYYTEYMLKYSLTDKEMEDYKTFHKSKYLQAVFLNDYISANKPCTIVSRVNVDIETHKGLEERMRVEDSVESTLGTTNQQLFLIFNSFDAETRYFNVYAIKFAKETLNMTTSSKVANIPMRAWHNYTFDNNMIKFSSYGRANYDIYESSEVDSTSVYFCQTTDLLSDSANVRDALK